MTETKRASLAEVADHTGNTFEARAWAAPGATSPLASATIRRRTPGPQDAQIDVLYCGIRHSDLHQARNEWQKVMPTVYPCVAGHEIVGRVTKVGSAVKAGTAAGKVGLAK